MLTFTQWLEATHRIEQPWHGGEPELPVTDYSKGYHQGKKRLAKLDKQRKASNLAQAHQIDAKGKKVKSQDDNEIDLDADISDLF